MLSHGRVDEHQPRLPTPPREPSGGGWPAAMQHRHGGVRHHGARRVIGRGDRGRSVSGAQSSPAAAVLAWVCAEEPGIRASLERAGDTSPLDRLLAAARGGSEMSDLLDELHAALQRCGDAPGGFGPIRRGTDDRGYGESGFRPVGLGSPRPVEVAFHCPRGTCSRDWQPDPAAPASSPPICPVYGEVMRWTRLR